ncbi:MAG: adenylate/guanylate cyclase domain-containing protein [Gammaproteobacteria bacterium]
MALDTRPLAIMFADISGSTRLYEVLGDAQARAKVATCLALLTTVTERRGGTVVKTIGDEVMCTFGDVEQAAIAACEMQEAIAEQVTEQSDSGPLSMSIRIGLHFGPAIVEATDVFGDAVNVAARMESMAKPGQIITTASTVEALPPVLKANTRCIDHAPVKGKKQTMDIHEILWQHEDITRMSSPVTPVSRESVARLRFTYHDHVLVMDQERTLVVLGRSKTADLSVDEALASRLHVKVEQRRGKYFLIDQSTNGTYVMHGGHEAFLRREEMPLTGRGTLSLGRPFKENPSEVVHFSIDA